MPVVVSIKAVQEHSAWLDPFIILSTIYQAVHVSDGVKAFDFVMARNSQDFATLCPSLISTKFENFIRAIFTLKRVVLVVKIEHKGLHQQFHRIVVPESNTRPGSMLERKELSHRELSLK